MNIFNNINITRYNIIFIFKKIRNKSDLKKIG